MCGFKKFNAVTVSDSYTLLRMDDLLHAAKRTSYMSTLVLRLGYLEIKVCECYVKKTAFTTPFETLERKNRNLKF